MIFNNNEELKLPEIDDYWQEYINAQLATVPEGKSFIYFADNHYEESTEKIGKLTDYTRKVLGVKTVIDGGDPYGTGNTKALAEQKFTRGVVTDFLDYVGTDGLYVIGNHDSNYLTYRDANPDGLKKYELLVSDTYIFDNSVKLMGDKAVFDTATINIIKTFYNEGKFVNAEFRTGGYTAEQMRDEAIAWAKMHYYYDDEALGIRYIVLDTGGLGLTNLYFLNEKWSTPMYHQLDWLAGVLLGTPADYDIVVTGHMFSDRTDVHCTQTELFKMLAAFRNKLKVTILFKGGGTELANLLLPNGSAGTKEYDFTSSAFIGAVVAISGHTHVDCASIFYYDNGKFVSDVKYTDGMTVPQNAVFSIVHNNDKVDKPNSEFIPEANDPIMIKGTTTEDCFSVITIKDNGDIVMTRLGAGNSRTFRYCGQ